MNGPQWDYKVVWIGFQGHDSFLWKTDEGEVFVGKWSKLTMHLQRHGDDGWELVSDVEGAFSRACALASSSKDLVNNEN